MNAEEIIEAIQKMSNAERMKLLDYMYENYFYKPLPPEALKKLEKYLEDDDYEY